MSHLHDTQTHGVFSAKTGEQRTTAFTEVISNDLLMKLGGGGDKVCVRLSACA